MGSGMVSPSVLVETLAGTLGSKSIFWRVPVVTIVWRSDGSVTPSGMSNGILKLSLPTN